ncbi:MAG TPA: LLM class flavin-dependent oxidoreductase [Alphaproteobacteria bacterium]|jgi:alkanesulfonate monooxygenase SsuD/methylene tetrahydromethanopterin reductase-like flavin-dependent oxidoreductase (luciferase family)|nr:LLM class flavin-dependent oxidoreductase [Alphaproteobacteria bacterium]
MEFGVQFFPDLGPDQKSGEAYWSDALAICDLCDELGYTHIRTVEHYFNPYGGYSPSPLLFLTAASQRSKKARLVTGAVLPVFNNPLKLAGEIGMLDAISHGRLEVGFARAFLPLEFARFNISLDESKARFAEGMEMVRRLLEEENLSMEGQFHRFKNVTSLPRPTQKPRPPFWIAALATPDSFINAGKAGHSVMAIPMAGAQMAELIGLYRDAWRSAGHPGKGRVMLAFHMFCHEDHERAVAIARDPLNCYLKTLVRAASDWTGGLSSADYPGYDKIIAGLAKETFDTQTAKGAAWIGTPDEIADVIADYQRKTGGFESASLQVNFNTIPLDEAMRSMRLFSQRAMPKFADKAKAA